MKNIGGQITKCGSFFGSPEQLLKRTWPVLIHDNCYMKSEFQLSTFTNCDSPSCSLKLTLPVHLSS